jgi:hypothetical protein
LDLKWKTAKVHPKGGRVDLQDQDEENLVGALIKIRTSIIKEKGKEAMISSRDMWILIEIWNPSKRTPWRMTWRKVIMGIRMNLLKEL